MTKTNYNLCFLLISILLINCDTKNKKEEISNQEVEIQTTVEIIKHSENKEKELSLKVKTDTVGNFSNNAPSNIYDFTFYLPNELEEWYSKNHDKDEMSKKWVIGQFYDQPTLKALKIGELLAYYNPEINNFALQFKSIDGTIKKELTEIGDWGYGLHINVIEVTDKFVRIPNAYFNTEVWLKYSKEDHIKNEIFGQYNSYLNKIVSLSKVKAIDLTTEKQVVLDANINYLIEKHTKGRFMIRKEISEDMPCGEEIDQETDVRTLKRFFINICDLKDESGNYQIKTAYPRGC